MTSVTPTITEDDIAQYLLTTPDFFTRHAELLARVQLTHPHSGRAISLADRQIELLRERYKQLEHKHVHLLGLGKENVGLANKLHQWVLGLLAYAGSPDRAATALQLCSSLESIFDMPRAVVDTRQTSHDAAARMTSPVCGLSSDPFFLDNHITACLPNPAEAKSLAVIALPTLGLLVLASPDPQRFTAQMGTEFLTRLGELAHAALHA